MPMKEQVHCFCEEFGYPPEAASVLLDACDVLSAHEEALASFIGCVDSYNRDTLSDYSAATSVLDLAAEACGVHRYTLHLLFFIRLSLHTMELYNKRGIPLAIYTDSMMDLKLKMIDCHRRVDIWGIFVADWIKGFFDLTRFTLGRLQFEMITYGRHYDRKGFVLNPEDRVINVHIPSSGPLDHEDCMESYRLAAAFFKDEFQGRPTAFVCHSWLLFPPNREILAQTSNILKFMNDYEITDFTTDEGEDLWRIFYKDYSGDPESWPHDTSLRRAYIRWLKDGNKPGSGNGIFFFDGQSIL